MMSERIERVARRHPSCAPRMAQAARQWIVEEFSSERLAAKTADVYMRELSARQLPRRRPAAVADRPRAVDHRARS